MNFSNFKIDSKIQNALKDLKYIAPSPIQEKAIPVALEGKDILGCAQTGTGKTCAFMVPIINRIIEQNNNSHKVLALVLTPTRELAIQIYENTIQYSKYTTLKAAAIYGGVKEGKQKEAIKNGIDILIATPGRLLDFLQQKIVNISQIQGFVLDEADRMLDMGFVNDVKKIISYLPRNRQTMLFSATMPDSIVDLANSLLKNPTHISVDPPTSTVDLIDQKLYYVDKENKIDLLDELLKTKNIYNALVFSRTKHGADKIAKKLMQKGVKADSIHGDKSQNARQRALESFKSGKLQVLVATDIAARGIDIHELTHVINFDLPDTVETYVHRIGRTARAGHDGIAITLCTYEEKPMVTEIEKKCKISIKVEDNLSYPMKNFTVAKKVSKSVNRSTSSSKQNDRANSKNSNIIVRKENSKAKELTKNISKKNENHSNLKQANIKKSNSRKNYRRDA